MPARDGHALDKTGRAFDARFRRDERRLPHQPIMFKPALLRCEFCNGTVMHVVADASETAVSGLIQIRCAAPRCGAVMPEMEMHIPQMNDEVARVARATDLWVPPIIEDIDIPRG